MSDFQEAVAPAEETTPNAGISIPGESAAEPSSSDVESRARAMGWVPKEEFRGPDDKWRSAEEFVERGENELPILRERSREMQRKIADLEAKIGTTDQAYRDRLERIERASAVALNKQREQLVTAFDQAMRNAVELGDIQRYDQLNRDRYQAVHDFDQHVQQQVHLQHQQMRPHLPPEDARTVNTWTQQNPWFDKDPVLNLAAQEAHVRLRHEQPGMSLEQNLAETRKAVMQRYPQKFGITQQTHQGVEGGQRMPSSFSRKKGASDIPAEDRRTGEAFVRDGLFKDINEYAKVYWEDNA